MTHIQLSHGGGGEETNALIHALFYEAFGNDILIRAEDAAVLNVGGRIAFTTDSFTVTPLFFAGSDIGRLAVAGTVNDLAMMGARPLYLSSAFIIEEGFSYLDLQKIVYSMRDELAESGARIVCGDTKVVPKGSVDKLFINTSGIGEIVREGISSLNLHEGDAILVSRDIGRHGAAILAAREGIDLHSGLTSDCATLWGAVEVLLEAGIRLHALRDATRGGVAAVLNEWAQSSDVCIHVDEASVPVCDEVRGICELLGFEPYDFANEGTFLLAVHPDDADRALARLQTMAISASAARIGEVTLEKPGRVILRSAWGSRRYLDLPKGELLPRIC